MRATVTISSRGVVTLPAKLRQALGLQADDHLIAEATPARQREFDQAEAELAAQLGRKPAPKRRRARAAKR